MKKLNLHQVEQSLIGMGLSIFTPRDLMMIFGVEKRAAEAFLSYNVKKGAVHHLKAGLFGLAGNLPGSFTVANRLYRPSYISLETALSYHGLIPESVYSVTSVTTKPTREFVAQNLRFIYQKIKKEAYTGYILADVAGERVNLALPEKALADYLYFLYLGKKADNDRLDAGKIDFRKLEEYLELFGRKGLLEMAGRRLKENA